MLRQIMEAISQTLLAVFGNGYSVSFDQTNQEIEKPYFLILPLTPNEQRYVANRYKRTYPLEIQFFPANKDDALEIATVIDQLFDTVEYITVDGNLIRGEISSPEKKEGIAHFYVEYTFFVFKDTVTEESMERVEHSEGVK